MKKSVLPILILALPQFFSSQKAEDISSIKNMAGCYQVEFNFSETFSPNKDYEKYDNYKSGGLEYIAIVEDQPKKIVLQHILVVNPNGEGKNAIVKHWRQDWQYENTDMHVFDHGNHWKFVSIPENKAKGTWTQKVYQVDDSPRYSGVGTWVHVDGKDYWESSSDAPLPRREYSKRKDYNVLQRNNRHEITPYGWLHDQDNVKILRENGEDKLIAMEKGLEYYRKVDDSKCKIAKDYWNTYGNIWKEVRNVWSEELGKKKDLYVKPNTKDTYLYSQLIDLEPGQEKKVKPIIKEFIIEK